jgi:hypothetical protein
LTGCDPVADDRLLVATSWSASDRQEIELDFAAWLNEQPVASSHGPIKLDWLIFATGDDLERLAARRHPPDVLLGGPARAFDQLGEAKRLSPLPIDGSPVWAVSRRGAIRLASAANENLEPIPPSERSSIAFDDPRKAPISLAWAEAQVRSASFPDGYARLVRAAANGPRIGRQAGSSSAAVERGEANRAPEVFWRDQDTTGTGVVPWIEGVAILSDARHRDRAATFLEFLARTGRAGSVPNHANPAPSDDHDLLADLLGATLVDAQDELLAAWSALERAGSPPNPFRWMTEPPPWPPASIAKIQSRQGEEAMAMVETLAGQLATDPVVRAWLVRSWLSPPRLIDLRVLEELTRAVDGRLIREPRFREWLRAEWTAWARQRYRRVARSARSGGQWSVVSEDRLIIVLTDPGLWPVRANRAASVLTSDH